jgi:hypothetical protein
MMEQVCPVVAAVSRPIPEDEFLRGIAHAVLLRAGDGPRDVRAAAARVTESMGNAYFWHALLHAVRRARMSASLESAIRACIQEINAS